MSNLKDCIYGLSVGDALGVPFEFKERDSFKCLGMVGHGTHNQPAGTWSDDTSMALAICDSYKHLHRIDTQNMYMRFLDWRNNGKYTIDGIFDIGNTVNKALFNGVGCDSIYNNGNGSLMRTLPLAFTNATDEQIEQVSAITHAHRYSTKACVILVKIARLLVDNKVSKDVLLKQFISIPRNNIKSTGYVIDTLKASLWCVANTDSYKDCVLMAVNLGDDTDTVAAIAGGLAGIIYGLNDIPTSWIDTLRGKEIIDSCLF